ncbi:hypothetical protein BKA56DRAFT_614252 [Ilyonectria sp. MPI-CAGE-AT-0026]|nr:hypothetical protein BKA56DRAFT_614252 [Ilyonectria sp. MPI-CAGE-AT-0026]
MSDNGQDGKHPFTDYDRGKAPHELDIEIMPSLGPQPKSDMEAGVHDILEKLHQTTINAHTGWTKVTESGCMRLWAATKKGGDVTLEPVIGGLKKFLKELYAQECTSASGSMVCKGVEVCFLWKAANEVEPDTWTPPCKEENSEDEKSDEKSDKKSEDKK